MLTVGFARDMDYLFVAQYIVEVLDDRNNFIWRQKPGCQPSLLVKSVFE